MMCNYPPPSCLALTMDAVGLARGIGTWLERVRTCLFVIRFVAAAIVASLNGRAGEGKEVLRGIC